MNTSAPEFEVRVTYSFLEDLILQRDAALSRAADSALESNRSRRAFTLASALCAFMTGIAIAFAFLWWIA